MNEGKYMKILTTKAIETLANSAEQSVLLAYGSLLNKNSREEHSNIRADGIPLLVNGWERGWITRSTSEKQTYVGAIQNSEKSLNALALPISIDQKLTKREQDYRFTEVSFSELDFNVEISEQTISKLQSKRFLICETLAIAPSSEDFPVYQSYIDTCIAGAIESNGESYGAQFITTTSDWSNLNTINDRTVPCYMRAAEVNQQMQNLIDKLLKE
jgi:hypothetical protein